MQTIEARAILSAADRTGGIFSQIAAKIRGMNAAAVNANRTTRATGAMAAASSRASMAAASANGAIMAGAGRVLAPAAAAAFAGKAFKNYADADLAVQRIGITADASADEVKDLNKQLRTITSDTGKPFEEVTKGLADLTAGGMELKDSMKSLPAIVKTAQASGAEVSDMSTTALALSQNLGIEADKMQNAFDIMVKGGKAGKFELKDMARYFPSIAPAAVAAGMKGEEGLMRITAALQTIRAGTGTTEEAASSMQNVFAKMESETTVARFKKFGIDLRKEMTKARKEGKDLLETFVGLSEKALKGDLSKIPQLYSDMEFARAMRGLHSFKDLNKKILQDLKTSAGSSAKDFEKIMNTPAIATQRLKNSFDALLNSVGKGIDELGKKLGSKDGTSGWLSRTAEELDDLLDNGLQSPTRQKYWDEQDKERETASLQKTVDRQQELANRARERGGQIPQHRVEQMMANQARLYQLQNEVKGPIFTEAEIQKLRETSLKDLGERVPTPLGDPRKTKGFAPMPASDPRKQGFGSELPPVQGLDLANALSKANVEAKLTGEAEVKGQTEVKVTVEASSEFLRIVDSVKTGIVNLNGKLRANGPGSTGISSPDAAPASVGTGAP